MQKYNDYGDSNDLVFGPANYSDFNIARKGPPLAVVAQETYGLGLFATFANAVARTLARKPAGQPKAADVQAPAHSVDLIQHAL